MLEPSIVKNDRKARLLIYTISLFIFAAIVLLGNLKFKIVTGFDVHIFALISAIINSLVTILLIAGLVAVKQGKYVIHKKIMLTAISLSVLFLLSYIAHHLLAGETKFGDTNHDGILSADEILAAGNMRLVYYILLLTHIPLAAIILPFILFTAYRALTGEYEAHKKLTRITWPVWLYVAITGVLVYVMIHPYYH